MGADQSLEREWLRQTASGDRLAFEQLYHAYHRRIFGYLHRMLSSAEAAEEAAGDVMLDVWKGAGGFRGESQVSTWIFGIARFKALSIMRKPREHAVGVEEVEQFRDPQELPDQVMVKDSVKASIKKALTRLSQEHREVMELTFFQEFSYPEIAQLLGCPVNTIKTRMFYARKQLRELLSVEGTP